MIFNTVEIEFWLRKIIDILWQGPLLVILLGAGLFLTIKLRGLQFRYFGHAVKVLFRSNSSTIGKKCTGDIKPFQSLMTALAGSIGTGNITGIATAVVIGGVGSLFWMWVMALIGMATAYSETLLSLKYREKNSDGVMSGGPMFTLLHGLKNNKIAALYALFGALSVLGIGCLAQSNSMVDAIYAAHESNRFLLGILLAILVGAVIIGGVKTIGRVAGILVPFMATAYFLAGLTVLIFNVEHILPAFALIIKSAFSGQAAVGGFLGSSFIMAIQNGVQFGIFANEAGLGTLAIAGASAKTREPAEQGFMSICGVFFATMVICTITGLVLAVSGVVGFQVGGKALIGSPLAMSAFATVHPSFSYVVLIGLNLFAFTTMLAWSYYGEKCVEFLFGVKAGHVYRWIFVIAVVVGAVLELRLVWAIANLATALLALPNLVANIGLVKVVQTETKEYFSRVKANKILNECKENNDKIKLQSE